ncbi:MAG TPA: peptide ligase PGM1-related protein [Lacibacter sp.]|nr:peptide ligase PGM1-related protein [Lacibacter sp.]
MKQESNQHFGSESGQSKNDLFSEREQFYRLQMELPGQFQTTFPDKLAERTVIVVPSLTLDQDTLSKVKGHVYYEERLLCLLLLLRMPRTHMVYVTSVPVDPIIIDYYLHLLPGITGYHAGKRLTLLSCYDASAKSLTEKILDRPKLIRRIKDCLVPERPAHITCFNVTPLERKLALELQLPVYGCDPDLSYLGSKTEARKLFRQCGIPLPDGFEDVISKEEVIDKLAELKERYPHLRKAVIKMNDGFSGEGNAVFSYPAKVPPDWKEWIAGHLEEQMNVVADDLSVQRFFEKFERMEGIVEVFVEGSIKTSPSVQCRINPLGKIDVLSTHDQDLGGDDAQVFLGASFPANTEYAAQLGTYALKVAEVLKQKGVLGRFGIDFISVKEAHEWQHYAIEINLRKGGTTHPYLMLQFLTEGDYDADSGCFYMKDGKKRFYYATDNLYHECFKGLTPHDLIDIAMCNGLHYSNSTEEGVMFHLISSLSQYGKTGLVAIGSTPERAKAYYEKVIEVLMKECRIP